MKSKNLDAIILNSMNDKGAGFGHDTNKITLITPTEERNFELKSGQYKLGVTRDGYNFFQEDTYIGKGDRQVINVVLEKPKGAISIFRQEKLKGVKNLLKYEFRPGTVFRIKEPGKSLHKKMKPDKKDGFNNIWELPAGNYELIVESAGYFKHATTFEVKPKVETSLGIVLKSIESVKTEIKLLKQKRNVSFCFSPALLAVSIPLKSSANRKYEDYQIATSDADKLRKDIKLNDMMSSSLLIASGISLIQPLYYQSKINFLEKKLLK